LPSNSSADADDEPSNSSADPVDEPSNSSADPATPILSGMSDTDVYVSPSRVPALVALLLAVVGAAGMAWSFVNGINAAFDGAGGGAGAWIVVFFVSGALVLAALVTSVVCLVRGKARVIAGLALLVSLVPIVVLIVLRFANT
jgi:hypothetical protein